jgi:hypothetical protein
MKRVSLALWAVALLFLLAGCETNTNYRSADFSGNKTYKKGAAPGPQLKENEVLGLRNTRAVKDTDIERILNEASSLRIAEGSTILLVQSGVAHPDKEMVDALSKHFVVVPHTGVPNELRSDPDDDISKALRLAAAHSKAETLLVYWGHLEMMRDDLPTSLVSWVPVVDFTVPDEYQRVRMHLKAALIDVRSGNWATFRTEPIESDALTTRFAREHEQKWPIQNTKQRLYKNSVERILKAYVMARN